MFLVKDGTNAPIVGATVIARAQPANTISLNGVTDSNGNIDLSGLADGNYTLLAFKPGAFAGVRVDSAVLGGNVLPIALALVKVAQLSMAFSVYKGTYSTPLAGVLVVVKDQNGATAWSGTTNSVGNASQLVAAGAFAGWTATFTVPGLDGVIVPLDSFAFSSPYRVVLAPTIAADE